MLLSTIAFVGVVVVVVLVLVGDFAPQKKIKTREYNEMPLLLLAISYLYILKTIIIVMIVIHLMIMMVGMNYRG